MCNNSPLDFPVVARALIGPALAQIEAGRIQDNAAIEAIDDRHLTDRTQRMQKWLRAYGVFQGITTAERQRIAQAVVVYADQRNLLGPDCGGAAIRREFKKLHDRCSLALGRERDLTSLTSKALWVCYPDVVPIYDGYAVRALQVISRLVPLNLTEQRQWPDGLEKYAPYLEIWIQLYAKAAPVISEAAADYLHRVRIFDKMLWLIGKRTYGVA